MPPMPYQGSPMMMLGGKLAQNAATSKAKDLAKYRAGYEGQYKIGTNRSRDQGIAGQDAYLQGMQNFDPSSYLADTARGQFNILRPDMENYMASLRGQQVGMGRLDTGFATEGEDRVTTEALRGLDDRLLANSMNSAGMEMQKYNSLGQYGNQNYDRAMEMNSSGWDRKVAADNAKKKKKHGIFGTIGSVLGGAGGFLLGGPAGAAAGAKIGGSIGSGFGG